MLKAMHAVMQKSLPRLNAKFNSTASLLASYTSIPYLFVLPEQSSKRVKLVTILINVRHAASQARLQVLGVVAEDQHNHSPGQRSERWPGVVVDRAVKRLGRYDRQAGAGLNGDACEGEHDARKDVDDDLLVDR